MIFHKIGRIQLAGSYKIGRTGDKNRLSGKKTALYFVCFFVLIFISALLQTNCLSLFGKVPALTFAVVCAIGFLCGDKIGAVSGIFGGLSVDLLGNSGISFSPILYMLCGYLCGALMGWFLSKNLPSFIVFAAIAGVLREIYILVCCGLISKNFQILQIITKLLIPEYFAYLVCVIPAYGAIWVIDTLIKGKDKRGRSDF